MKKIFSIFLAIMLTSFCFANIPHAKAEEFSFLQGDEFKSYILCDSVSGQIISEKEANTVIEDTGLSQLMSILIFLETIDKGSLKLDDYVRISKNAADQGGSQIFLEYGDNYSIETLLKGCIVVSANDACIALAERIAGSEDDFIVMMNKKAKDMGLINTVFYDPTGFNTSGETTTATDMAKICMEICKYPLFFEYSGIWQDSIPHSGRSRVTDIVNANRVINYNENCNGMGVGSSKKTGYSIAASTKGENSDFLFIGIGAKSSKSRFSASDDVLEYVVNAYETKNIINKDQLLKRDYYIEGGDKKEICLYAQEGVNIVLKKEESESIKKELKLYEDIKLPLKAGDTVGEVVFTLGGKKLCSINVIVKEDINEKDFKYSLNRVIKYMII